MQARAGKFQIAAKLPCAHKTGVELHNSCSIREIVGQAAASTNALAIIFVKGTSNAAAVSPKTLRKALRFSLLAFKAPLIGKHDTAEADDS